MSHPFADVCAARIPAAELARLAEVRTLSGVTVHRQDDAAWIRWENQDEQVLRRLLPIAGVVLYSWRDGRWCRFGTALPAFEFPVEAEYQALYQMLFPAPVQPLPAPGERAWRPIRLCLRPDQQPRPVSALLAPATDILAWADNVPSFRLEELQAAANGHGILLLAKRLPAILSGRRFWGKGVLVPLGFRLEPNLAETTIRAAFGLVKGELLLTDEAGEQIIPRDAFEPLCRSGLRRLAPEGQR